MNISGYMHVMMIAVWCLHSVRTLGVRGLQLLLVLLLLVMVEVVRVLVSVRSNVRMLRGNNRLKRSSVIIDTEKNLSILFTILITYKFMCSLSKTYEVCCVVMIGRDVAGEKRNKRGGRKCE